MHQVEGILRAYCTCYFDYSETERARSASRNCIMYSLQTGRQFVIVHRRHLKSCMPIQVVYARSSPYTPKPSSADSRSIKHFRGLGFLLRRNHQNTARQLLTLFCGTYYRCIWDWVWLWRCPSCTVNKQERPKKSQQKKGHLFIKFFLTSLPANSL